jgi:hypothetical protein
MAVKSIAAAAGARPAVCLAGRTGQRVARTAWRMTPVTTPGLEIMDTCGAPGTRVMRAFAVCAMATSSAGAMAWSAVPITAQDGIVFQAGTPDG